MMNFHYYHTAKHVLLEFYLYITIEVKASVTISKNFSSFNNREVKNNPV